MPGEEGHVLSPCSEAPLEACHASGALGCDGDICHPTCSACRVWRLGLHGILWS